MCIHEWYFSLQNHANISYYRLTSREKDVVEYHAKIYSITYIALLLETKSREIQNHPILDWPQHQRFALVNQFHELFALSKKKKKERKIFQCQQILLLLIVEVTTSKSD